MKEMIKRIREEKGGFTLAELLIVVAIVLVLVAIAVPVFTSSLKNATDATYDANVRAARAEAAHDFMVNHGKDDEGVYSVTIYYTDTNNHEKGDIVLTYDGSKSSGSETLTPAKATWDGKTNVTGKIVITQDDIKNTNP